MDKYEFNIKVEQIKKLVNKNDFATAMKISDTIDWRRVRNANLLSMISQVYEKNREYQEAKEVLLLAYERAPIGKRLLYKLTELALKEGSIDEAEDYYREFCDLAPEDTRQHILRYLILKEKDGPIDQLIRTLERYTTAELDEKWMYELAELYARAGRSADCVQLCDKMILLFGIGIYVEKAMDLKQRYAPLTRYQRNLVENRDVYEERLREVEEEYENGTGRFYDPQNRYETDGGAYGNQTQNDYGAGSGAYEGQDGSYGTGNDAYGNQVSDGYGAGGNVYGEQTGYGGYGEQVQNGYGTGDNAYGNQVPDNYEAGNGGYGNQVAGGYGAQTGYGAYDQTGYGAGNNAYGGSQSGYESGNYGYGYTQGSDYEAGEGQGYVSSEQGYVQDDVRVYGNPDRRYMEENSAYGSSEDGAYGQESRNYGSRVSSIANMEGVDEELMANIHQAAAEKQLAAEMSRISTEGYTETAPRSGHTKIFRERRGGRVVAPYVRPDLPEEDRRQTSSYNRSYIPHHLMIEAKTPEEGFGAAVEVLKKIHEETGIHNQVIKISGSRLSSRGVFNVSDKLAGKDLIVEEAGDLVQQDLEELQMLLERDETGMIVVLIDNPLQMEELHRQNPGFVNLFKCISADRAEEWQGGQEAFSDGGETGEDRSGSEEQQACARGEAREEEAYEEQDDTQREDGSSAEDSGDDSRYKADRSEDGSGEYEDNQYEEESEDDSEYEDESGEESEDDDGYEDGEYSDESEDDDGYEDGEYSDESEDDGGYEDNEYGDESGDDGSYEDDEYGDGSYDHGGYEDDGYGDDSGDDGRYEDDEYGDGSEEEDGYEEETYEDDSDEEGRERDPEDDEELSLNEFADYAVEYANDIDCSITGKSMLALYERIEIMEEDGIPLTRANAEDLIEEAADKAEKPSLGGLIKNVFSSKYNKEGMLILKEEHFI